MDLPLHPDISQLDRRRRGCFAKLTKRWLKRGVFKGVLDPQAAINRFLAETNDDPRPFTLTADPAKIIAAVKRGDQTLDLCTRSCGHLSHP